MNPTFYFFFFFLNQKAASLPERAGLNVFPSTRPDQTERNNRSTKLVFFSVLLCNLHAPDDKSSSWRQKPQKETSSIISLLGLRRPLLAQPPHYRDLTDTNKQTAAAVKSHTAFQMLSTHTNKNVQGGFMHFMILIKVVHSDWLILTFMCK